MFRQKRVSRPMNTNRLRGEISVPFGALLVAAATVAMPGCQEALPSAKKEMKKPGVTVSYPIQNSVIDFEEFTGRVDAVNKVGIQAMVTGYLDEIKFKDGEDVQKDQVLFQIDPKTFEAKVKLSRASLDQAKAHHARLTGDLERGRVAMSSKAMSQEDFEKVRGDVLEAKAAIEMADAQLDQDTVNLNYTEVRSKITGRVSRRMIDKGNMVKANETMLTWVYQIDPMYGYFDVNERTVIMLRRLVNEGKIKTYRDDTIEVDVGLADEASYSLKGYIDWVDNVLDAGTGTLKIRCVIKQPRDKSGEPLILVSPGMFVRVKLPTSVPHDVVLIDEKAIGTDQGEKFVYVVNEKSEIERRNVTLGQMQTVMHGQTQYRLRVIEKNPPDKGKSLQASDKVVMSGLQRVHAGVAVEPTLAPMSGGVSPTNQLADQNGAGGNGKGTH
jgi:membrane fusion protein, multidrug efflux system